MVWSCDVHHSVRRMKTVGVIAKVESPLAAEGVGRVVKHLKSRNVAVCLDRKTAAVAGIDSYASTEELTERADLFVVLGGDGVFLSVARLTRDASVPVLGINLGSLGFLTEFCYEETIEALASVLEGEYAYEDRVMLDITFVRDGSIEGPFPTLNDLNIHRGATARMLTMRVSVGDLFLNEYSADGLLVSTPTGSTAYNLSCGGPIIHPGLGAFIISPICPHTLSNRPIVLPDDQKIEISFRPGDRVKAAASLDGQVGRSLDERDTIRVERSAKMTRIVLSQKNNYYRLLREKLKWGETIRNDHR